jgi:hypothetical protein
MNGRRAAGETIVPALAYTIALVLLTGVPLSRAMDESGLPLTGLVGYDFGAYYHGARSILAGMSPYFPETVAGPFPLKVSWYLYPPPFAALMTPFALLPAPVANVVWSLLLATAVLVTAAIVAGAGDPRRADPPIAIVIALSLGLSVPGMSGIGQGAVTVLLGLFSLAPLLARSDRLAGAATALAALAKIEPALWGAYLAGAWRVRALVVAAGTGLGIIILTYALPGVRAAWAEYPTVLANAAASERTVGGNSGIGAMLGLSPGISHAAELGLLVLAAALMLLAGWYGVRFAPLASSVGLVATPSLWSHAAFLVVPGALALIAMGSGLVVRRGEGRVTLSGVRSAELFAVGFLLMSYLCFLIGLDRLMVYMIVLPPAAAAAWWGPVGRRAWASPART